MVRQASDGSRTSLVDHPEIPDSVKGGLEIIPVSRMDEVLGHSLTRKPESIVWDETAKPAALEKASSTLTAH